jgi:hypothetical protein
VNQSVTRPLIGPEASRPEFLEKLFGSVPLALVCYPLNLLSRISGKGMEGAKREKKKKKKKIRERERQYSKENESIYL